MAGSNDGWRDGTSLVKVDTLGDALRAKDGAAEGDLLGEADALEVALGKIL